MNISYWLLIAVLVGIAWLFVIPPLWRRHSLASTDDDANTAIAKQKLIELQKQLQAGVLDEDEFAAQHQELLLILNDEIKPQPAPPSDNGRWAIPIVGFGIPVFSLLLYFAIGEPMALEKAAQTQQNQQEASIESMVAQLATKLQQNPTDGTGWLMLGRSYKYMRQFPKAVAAFAKAHAILGEDAELLLDYADALAMAQGGKLQGKAEEMVLRSLELLPDSVSGLWLAGMASTERGEHGEALAYWQKLRGILPADSADLVELQKLIDQAETSKTLPAQTKISPPPKATKSAISITVAADIAQNLSGKINKSDTLFIYAKAQSGAKMPLAIVRKLAGDLPLEVQLDDSLAMLPEFKLSQFTAVTVLARISKTGSAVPQKGDWFGELAIDNLQGNIFADITINQQIK